MVPCLSKRLITSRWNVNAAYSSPVLRSFVYRREGKNDRTVAALLGRRIILCIRSLPRIPARSNRLRCSPPSTPPLSALINQLPFVVFRERRLWRNRPGTFSWRIATVSRARSIDTSRTLAAALKSLRLLRPSERRIDLSGR